VDEKDLKEAINRFQDYLKSVDQLPSQKKKGLWKIP